MYDTQAIKCRPSLLKACFKHILQIEGCPVCLKTSLFSPQSKDTAAEQEQEQVYVILQCQSFGCCHVMHYSCLCELSNSSTVVINFSHSSDFFDTSLETDETAAHMDLRSLQNPLQNSSGLQYQVLFQINHLISNQNQMCPQMLESVIDPKRNNIERVRLFLNFVKLEAWNGRLRFSVSDGVRNFVCDANYDIPYPTEKLLCELRLSPAKKCIYKLYLKPNSNNDDEHSLIWSAIVSLSYNPVKKSPVLNLVSMQVEITKNQISCNSVQSASLSPSMEAAGSAQAEECSLHYCCPPMINNACSSTAVVPAAINSIISDIGNIGCYSNQITTCNNSNSNSKNSNNLSSCLSTSTNLTSNNCIQNYKLYSANNLVAGNSNRPGMSGVDLCARALFEFACTRAGSRNLCRKLSNMISNANVDNDKSQLDCKFSAYYSKLARFFPELIKDQYGHFVARMIYQNPLCDKCAMLSSLIKTFKLMAMNKQCSFAISALLSLVSSKQEILILIKCLKYMPAKQDKKQNPPITLEAIALHPCGYHVVQKFLRFGYPYFNCIVDNVEKNFVLYARHHYGVPLIKTILDHIWQKHPLLFETDMLEYMLSFAKHTLELVCDQYGNYVIQQLLKVANVAVASQIKQMMLGSFARLAKDKFASNVVEKCLAQQNNWNLVIIEELLLQAKELIDHKYGNYCLQTALNLSLTDQAIVQKFHDAIYGHLDSLRPSIRKKWMHLLLLSKPRN